MEAGTNFSEFYNSELKGLIAPHEKERKRIAALGIFGTILIILSAAGIFYASSNNAQGFAIGAFISLIAAVILLVIFYNKRKNYVSWFKENIVHSIIKYIDPELQYNPAGCVHKNDYKNSGLYLEHTDRYRGDDYVEGRRDKTTFCFSEIHTQKKVTSGKSTHWETIFKGLFFIGDFNKNFQGRTFIYSENNPQLGFFSKLFNSFAWNLEKVKLESIEFESKFIVYSSDQVEARYILTPSFMERLVKLQDLMGDRTSYSFVDTNVYVAIPISDELFEPSVFSENDYNRLGDYYNTVQIVFDIIDELNLNLRIWNKE
ncbi:MAG TPA: DUF3137 domain-containing protein [Chitinophagaceae bacterium]|jgi:hypothetical protein|nr:DUF3137 domain-containing protein [Chitinophagaceae bacterium]